MDNGEVLVGLEEDWTFLGANLAEWVAGLIVFLLISLFGASPTKVMPLMLAGWLITTVSLAGLRRSYPDEQRGLRNALMTWCGVPPTGIPAPSALQPVWSNCPVRELPADSEFMALGFDKMFPSFQRDLTEAPTE